MKYTLEDMYGLHGKVCIVTGAGRGIGRELALGLASLGAQAVLVSLHQDMLDEGLKELEQHGLKGFAVAADITNEKDVENVAEQVMQKFGRIDALVNCAGVTHLEKIEDFDVERFKWVLDVNVTGAMICCKVFSRQMIAQQSGRIVNISSVRGLQGRATHSAYAASKGAINTFTKSLAVELATQGINVNAVAPIFTLTDMNKDLLDNKEVYDWVLSRIPKKKLCEKHQLVGPVAFLLSPCSDFITGDVLYVDGGWTAG